MQIKEVKVKFEENGKEYSFDTSNVFVRIGDRVVVDTARGQEMGTICSRVKQIEASEGEYKKVLRIATEQDLQNKENNIIKQEEIKNGSQKLADNLKLNMKIVKSEVSLDGGKVIISFTADDRVDFRELVKELANLYKMRIELRQVDAREEKLSYRLRESQIKKIPYTLVIGDKEVENNSVTYRKHGSREEINVSLSDFINLVKEDIKSKGKK